MRQDGVYVTLSSLVRTVPREYDMLTVKYVYWEEEGAWLGYLQQFPDYWTQGETLDDLKEHLRDVYADLNVGHLDIA